MHSQQPPGVVQNWSTLQCSKHDIEQCGYDHAPVTRGRMRAQFPLPHGPPRSAGAAGSALHAWPADMQSRRDSHRAPPRRPMSLKIGPQIKSNQIESNQLSTLPDRPPPPF